jgi:5-methylcytosine-specific restriction endonuclease McrA
MIQVVEALAPDDFDQRVRQPGLNAIAELVGEDPGILRRGRKRIKVAERREDIPGNAFPPLWREVLPDMLDKYKRLCAYLSLYIEHGTGSPTIDHVIPKSKAWDRVYEWSNFRLASSLMNSRKSDKLDVVLDPFDVNNDWLELEFFGYQVKPGLAALGKILTNVQNTIDTLHLNDDICCSARREYVEAYLCEDPIPFSYLERRAPFIARELRRQGLIRVEDL